MAGRAKMAALATDLRAAVVRASIVCNKREKYKVKGKKEEKINKHKHQTLIN
jgi:hypothetical protein